MAFEGRFAPFRYMDALKGGGFGRLHVVISSDTVNKGGLNYSAR